MDCSKVAKRSAKGCNGRTMSSIVEMRLDRSVTVGSAEESSEDMAQDGGGWDGIRIQNLQPGQIIMDIDFRWGGDPSIILAVDAVVASLPIQHDNFYPINLQLKDLQVYTVIRVVFQLSEEIPCISAVIVALLAEASQLDNKSLCLLSFSPEPKIQYTLKAIGGSLTAIPGLSDMIDDTVNSIVSDMLQWPHRLVVPLGVNVDTSDLELKPQGRLSVTVIKATSLKNKELIGKSDPYVVLYVRPMFKVKTKVKDDNLNPEWNETFDLIVEDKETQSVIFEALTWARLSAGRRPSASPRGVGGPKALGRQPSPSSAAGAPCCCRFAPLELTLPGPSSAVEAERQLLAVELRIASLELRSVEELER
ncbi:hypothetical protein PR202_gb29732 [Eleusine coracana subsp. coracana]|uniref:Uncharacterized protein n=1 Tax=Eleusine coracana subsp. coracana TaxID=191504 RepID=A0AAV5G197_ELECO|nr:hypothetical protein PR202_gb29732 [Eleusine coracana subsp. coracana]